MQSPKVLEPRGWALEDDGVPEPGGNDPLKDGFTRKRMDAPIGEPFFETNGRAKLDGRSRPK